MEQTGLPGIVTENVTQKPHSKPYQPRVSKASGSDGDQGSHEKTMPLMPDEGVTSGEKGRRSPHRGKKEGNSLASANLVASIVQFLEDKGLEVYPMENGGYQVKGDRETVRFYISRRNE